MLNEDLVSIVVCSYNNEKFILDCLNSIYDQSYKKIELLISDDCSTDKTYEIIKNWCLNHQNRFNRCIFKQNKSNVGISKNYNSVLKESQGKYIKIFAADDIMLNNAINDEVIYLNNNMQDQIVYANSIIINEDDNYPIVNLKNKKIFYESIPKSGVIPVKDLIKNSFIAAPTVMYRGDTFKKYGYFREDMSFEDWEYWIRLSKVGVSIGYLDNIIIAYRLYVGSSSHTGSGKNEENRFIKNTLTEEKIIMENSEYIDNNILSSFWSRVLSTTVKYNYQKAFNMFYDNIKYVKRIRTRIKIFLFKLISH